MHVSTFVVPDVLAVSNKFQCHVFYTTMPHYRRTHSKAASNSSQGDAQLLSSKIESLHTTRRPIDQATSSQWSKWIGVLALSGIVLKDSFQWLSINARSALHRLVPSGTKRCGNAAR